VPKFVDFGPELTELGLFENITEIQFF